MLQDPLQTNYTIKMPSNREKSSKVYGIIGSVMLHAFILALLWYVKIGTTETQDDEGGGIYVISGAGSPEWNYTASMPTEILEDGSEENITQELEESISLDDADKEKQRQEEDAKKAIEKAQAEEKREIDNLISGALGKTNNNNSGNNSEKKGGIGNSDNGAKSGYPGYGSFDLGGRGLKQGESLPVPQYDNSNDEGVIVVAIIVDSYGKVIQAQASPIGSSGAAYSNVTLRKRAVDSAKKALFEKSNDKNNQQGTITYRFVQKD